MRRLSSELTFLYQRVLPVIFGCMAALGCLACLTGSLSGRDGQPPPLLVKWIVLLVGSVGTVSLVAWGRSIQEVEMDDEKIRVIGRLGIEEIPLASIWSIEESFSQKPKLLILHVSPKSRYGETIRFIPTGWGRLSGEHPMIAEIEKAQKAASEKAAAR